MSGKHSPGILTKTRQASPNRTHACKTLTASADKNETVTADEKKRALVKV